MENKQSFITATGRRKTSAASVRLKEGKGVIVVNGRAFEDYFPQAVQRALVQQPLAVTNAQNKFDVTARVRGGGIVGQAGALRHGIARALVAFDVSFKEVLRNSGLLTRDARMHERKKPGQPGARKRFQFSKR